MNFSASMESKNYYSIYSISLIKYWNIKIKTYQYCLNSESVYIIGKNLIIAFK